MTIRSWSDAQNPAVTGSPGITPLLDGGFAVGGRGGVVHRFGRLGDGATTANPTPSGIFLDQGERFFGSTNIATLDSGNLIVSFTTFRPLGARSAVIETFSYIATPGGEIVSPVEYEKTDMTEFVPAPAGVLVLRSTYNEYTKNTGPYPPSPWTPEFVSSGEIFIGDTQVNEVSEGGQGGPDFCRLPNGWILVAWSNAPALDVATIPTAFPIRARWLDPDGRPAGPDITVAENGREVSLAALANGQILLAYTATSSLSEQAVRARIYDPSLGSFSPELVLADGPGISGAAKVTALQDGGFALAWQQSVASQSDVFVQQFSATGQALGATFQVANTGHEALGDLVTLTDGRLAITWFEGSIGARVQVLDPREGRVNGTDGADILVGSNALGDLITAWAGHDVVEGQWGDDTISLGGGDDAAWAGPGNDWVAGQEGHDWLVGDAGQDLMDGGPGSDSISGGSDADWQLGGDGNDVIWSGDGDDVVSGGAGDDYLLGGAGQDQIYGGTENDVFVCGRDEGQDSVFGEAGLDTLYFNDRTSHELVGISWLGDSFATAVFTDGGVIRFNGIEWLQFSDTGWSILS